MFRILKCLSNVKVGQPQIHPNAGHQKRSYPSDRPPTDEETDRTQTGDVRQSLSTGGPYHLRVDQMNAKDDTEEHFLVDEDPEDITKDRTFEDEETQEIIEGFYTGEPLRVRVDQIQRDEEEIQMIGSQMQQGKNPQNNKEDRENEVSLEEMSAAARRWREKRSQRYFPKLVKIFYHIPPYQTL